VSRGRLGSLLLPLLVWGCGAEDSADPNQVAPDPLALADGVTIDRVAIYQGVEVPLAEGGAAVEATLPLIAGRDAMLRIFASFDAGYDGGPLTARLRIDGEPVVETTQVLTQMWSQNSLASTINLDLDGELLGQVGSWSIELLEPREHGSGKNQGARHPASGQAVLAPPVAGPPLEILLVPLAYDADGSGRLPDTSPDQLERYRSLFYGTYPVSAVTITLAEPVATSEALSPDGGGWDELLDTLFALRLARAVPDPVALYGIVAPAVSEEAYCQELDCVTGLSYLADAASPEMRVGVGLGFAGQAAATLAIHEVGHQHGRDHAPCDVYDYDPAFPYEDGSIGRWGYDLVGRSLFAPDDTSDFMSYCTPAWVSDYTFRALLERMASVSPLVAPPPSQRYQLVPLDRAGTFHPGQVVTLPARRTEAVTLRGSIGERLVTMTGHFVPHAHGGGGGLLLRPLD
jgi:hypothetical protein